MENQVEPGPYSEPRAVTNPADCYFYHTVDIPGHGLVRGEWDLRPGLDAYLGHFDFRNKRVLDVGTASGVLTFHMERRGAAVVSYDLSEEQAWDLVPYARGDREREERTRSEHIRRINNGYWFCHRAFRSQAKTVYGTVYDIPPTIGAVDVAVFGSILLHLRDPFKALESAARLTREAIIVTEIAPGGFLGRFLRAPRFLPDHRRCGPYDAWWMLPPRIVREFLAILGFELAGLTWHRQEYSGRMRTLYTLVGRRTATSSTGPA